MGFLDSELIRTAVAPYPPPKDSSKGKKKCALDKLPAELREMIFMYAFGDEEWTGKTPDLIKALRTEDHIYVDCMSAWYRQKHTFVLHTKNSWSFLDMPPHVIVTITKVKIMVE